jgi:hypothetical protein
MAKSKFDKIRRKADKAFADLDSAVRELEMATGKSDTTRKKTKKKAKAKTDSAVREGELKTLRKGKAASGTGSAILRRGKAASTAGNMTPAAAEKAAFEMRLKRKYLSFPKAQREKLMQAERDRKKAKK